MMKDGWTNLLKAGFFPEKYTCDLCGIEIYGGNLCKTCRSAVTFNDGKTCPVCGRRTETEELCLECKAQAPLFQRAVSALVYEGGAVALIHKFKNGNGYLKEYFADLLMKKCNVFFGAQAICFVPCGPKAYKTRGYNQAELLAKALGKRLNLPVFANLLTKKRETEEQKTLTRREREKNLADVFRADKKLAEGKTLLLVDDVMTTGATADAAVAALKKAGAKCVYLATVASVEYQREI